MTTEAPGLPTLAASDLDTLVVLPGGVAELRRDLYEFLRYVEERGLVRTRRGNLISRTDARRLARRLSWSGEAAALEQEGGGVWSDYVSDVARRLKLVDFDTKGEYVGYTSTEPSFIDNEIVIRADHWMAYLEKSPAAKEKALLDVLLETTESELFCPATLVDGEAFDRRGSATGPASRMELPRIRRRLLKLLTSLAPDVWYEMRSLVELVKEREPGLILDPASREVDAACERRSRERERDEKERRRTGRTAKKKKPEVLLEDIYTNFREFAAGQSRFESEPRQITSETAGAFDRVEGRYLEFFLREVPYLCGFVDLAYRSPGDPHGLDVSPPFERLRAFRLRRRFFELMSGDPRLNHVKVTVLPTFEVVVEAPSYPEVTLETLEPFTCAVKDEGPVHALRLERKRVVETAAQNPEAATAAEVLSGLTGAPLPDNVAAELRAWSDHGEKVIFYEGCGLLEFRGGAGPKRGAREELGALLEEGGLERYAVVREPARALRLLEEGGHVPLRVKHAFDAFAPELEPSADETDRTPRARKPRRSAVSAVKVRLESEDLLGYRVPDASLLTALHTALEEKARTCLVADDRLVVSAAALPELRRALRRLRERFDVDIVGADSSGATNG